MIAFGTIVRRDVSDDPFVPEPECVSRCAVVTDLDKQFPEDDCSSSACLTASCTQSTINSLADCFGCTLAFNADAISVPAQALAISQASLNGVVGNCTAAGFKVSSVTITASKDASSEANSKTAQSITQTNMNTAQQNPSITPTNSAAPRQTSDAPQKDKNGGLPLSAEGTVVFIILMISGALLI
ncbi:hypothetical protein C8J56DRAFT_1060562 [Mycena floridula]|nr:hypothetical protein C8J56DRAFT_1060562 [Mycena floridula]